MDSTFKEGDKVICKDANGKLSIKEGTVYTVQTSQVLHHCEYIKLVEVGNCDFFATRFAHAHTQKTECTCSTRDLMIQGCKCGFLNK